MLPILATALLLVSAQGADSFPDTPSNHWAYEAKALMQSRGLLVGYPDGLGRWPVNGSRYEMAVAFHAALTNLKNELEEIHTRAERIAHDAGGSGAANRDASEFADLMKLLRAPLFDRAVGYLPRVQTEFAKEYKALGVSGNPFSQVVADYHATLASKTPQPGSALRQFRDVPSGHWAAKAVLELREQGILQGYPGGTFNGG